MCEAPMSDQRTIYRKVLDWRVEAEPIQPSSEPLWRVTARHFLDWDSAESRTLEVALETLALKIGVSRQEMLREFGLS